MLTINRITKAKTIALPDEDKRYYVYPAQAPLGLLNLAVGGVPGTEGEPQLVMSTGSLRSLKRYENRAATLPNNLEEITSELGAGSDIVGIRNIDLIALYLKVKRNSEDWGNIENGLIKTATTLNVFGTYIVNRAPQAVTFLQHIMFDFTIEDIDLASITIEQLHDEVFMEALFKLFDLDAEVTTQHMNMMKLVNITVDDLIENAQGFYEQSVALQSHIQSFKSGMMSCRDDVAHKYSILQEQHVHEDLVAKREVRSKLVDEIKALQDAYDYNQNLRWIALFGLIFVVIEECVFHKEAKRLAKQIDAKSIELQKLDIEIKVLSKLEEAVSSVDTQFQDYKVIFAAAEQGVNQLQYTWGLVVENLKIIRSGGEDLKSAKDIIEMWAGLSQVSAPWEMVIENTDIIIQQINDAIVHWDDDGLRYTKGYCVSAPALGETTSRFIPTEFNVKRLNNSFDNIRDAKSKLNDNFNPELNILCRDIYGYVVNTQEDLKGSLRVIESQSNALPTLLENMNGMIKHYLDLIAEETDPEKIEDYKANIARFKALGLKKVTPHIEEVSTYMNTLDTERSNIQLAKLTRLVDEFQASLKNKIKQNEQDLNKYTELKKQYYEEIEQIRAAQELLGTYGIFDMFTDAIPTADDINAMADVPTPQAKLIILGLKVFKTVIGFIGNGFNYNKLTDAMEWIRTNKLADAIRYYNESLDKSYNLRDEYTSLENVSVVDLERIPYCEELTHLLESYQSYANSLLNSSEQDLDFTNMIETFHLMYDYVVRINTDINSMYHQENPGYLKLSQSVRILLENPFFNIKGIDNGNIDKLKDAGVVSAAQLLKSGSTTAERKRLAEELGVDGKVILNWINRADLIRVEGVGSDYANLLELSGVDTVPELAQRNAKNLLDKMTETNADSSLGLPSLAQVEAWVEAADKLPRAIHY